ncbi:MAG TPA: SIR2 family protein [Pyrinomonadaceae bacterium]|nr:SIR2 family protein [Pyrinomonadaceae bacterium]
MADQITSSVVRLINQQGSVVGIGYRVSDNQVITCAQMVALALGITADSAPAPDAIVMVDFPFIEKGKRFEARILSWRTLDSELVVPLEEFADIAVLELGGVQQSETQAAKGLSEEDYQGMIDAIHGGELIPFLGAGVNLCDRPEGERWHPNGQFLPSGEELSRALALQFGYPWPDSHDLLRVSQYVALMHTLKRLYESLRAIFDREYPPTSLHKFFAGLPAQLAAKNLPSTFLIVTTNYDDLLETAFKKVNQPFDLVTYWIGDQNDQRGKLLHWTEHGKPRAIDDPATYDGIKLDEKRNLKNPVILKVHGAVDRTVSKAMRPRDSYVITEDNYLEYLTRSDIASLVPATIKEKFTQSSFLFLGYSLRDWNLRVFLNRIQMQQKQNLEFYKSWAIQRRPAELEQKFWDSRGVEIFDANLRDYVQDLDQRLQGNPPGGERP